jgi:hypothetical protein
VENQNGRYTNILLFEAFEGALRRLVAEDSQLFGWPKAKTGIAHCLATHLEDRLRAALGIAPDRATPLPKGMKVDLFVKVGTAYADILVHDRQGSRTLAILFGNDYLGRQQARTLRTLSALDVSLVLGIAFLPQKDYILIYRPDREQMDYYHFDRQEGTSSLFMKKEEGHRSDPLQLSLGIRRERKRGKRTTGKPTTDR